MKTAFDQNLCLAWLKKGRLRPAMEYLARFPEQAELYRQYISLYQQEQYLSYDVDSQLQDILLIVDIRERVIVHRLFEVDGVKNLDAVLIPYQNGPTFLDNPPFGVSDDI